MKTKKEIGYSLEDYIVDHFQLLDFDKARRSKGSGNRGELGDIAGQDVFVVECKKRTTKNITIQEDVWRKLCNEIPLKSKRMPMYVLENNNKRIWCVLEANDMFTIIKGYLENEENKSSQKSTKS